MRRRAGLLAAAIAGGIAGALIVLAIPVPGSMDVPQPPRPQVETPKVDTLLVWTPSRIPPELPGRIQQLPSVARVTVVRSGVGWVSWWRDRNGHREAPAFGFRVPLEVAAVDGSYRAFVPPADRPLLEGLEDGGVVLGTTAARIHSLSVGGTIALGGQADIEGVLDDTLIGAHELVVSREVGAGVGIIRPRYILVAPREGAEPAGVEAAIRRAVPGGVRVRVRRPGETPVFRHGDAVLPQIQVKEVFGEFAAKPRNDGTLDVSEGWERRNIQTARVPVLGSITCHRLVVPLVRAALEDLESRGLGRLVDPADYGGCYYPRYIARDAGTGISHHSWGIAIDINVSEGLPGRQPSLDRRIVDAFELQGFIWGGRFLIPDGTHFEFQRFP